MNSFLLIKWRQLLATMLQAGELSIEEGVVAMRELDRMENEKHPQMPGVMKAAA